MAIQSRETLCTYLYDEKKPTYKSICLGCLCNPNNNPEERNRCSNEVDSEGLIDAKFKQGDRVISRKKAILACDDFRKTI